MTLHEYRRKRNFRKTNEPSGAATRSEGHGRFVVQKHAAHRLHYDFRLELGGVLKSWAVPKGPSTDPHAKSLAVEVEDHPLEYAEFEGTIPQGEYGGGTVMVWDRGTWQPEGDAAQGLRQGKLNFELQGEKLRGRWTLVRMADRAQDRGRHNWLLIKRSGDGAKGESRGPTASADTSVVTGRTMDEIATAGDRVWSSQRGKRRSANRAKPRPLPKQLQRMLADLPGAVRRPLPQVLQPQLATLVGQVPAGEQWLHELKYDGYRILARIEGEQIKLLTRRGNDWAGRFPAAVKALAALGLDSAFLDGEIVALDEQGASDFQRLQNWLQRGDDDSLVYYVFDAPHLAGYDLTGAPLVDRKQALAKVLEARGEMEGLVRFSDHIRGQGDDVVAYACRAGETTGPGVFPRL